MRAPRARKQHYLAIFQKQLSGTMTRPACVGKKQRTDANLQCPFHAYTFRVISAIANSYPPSTPHLPPIYLSSTSF